MPNPPRTRIASCRLATGVLTQPRLGSKIVRRLECRADPQREDRKRQRRKQHLAGCATVCRRSPPSCGLRDDAAASRGLPEDND